MERRYTNVNIFRYLVRQGAYPISNEAEPRGLYPLSAVRTYSVSHYHFLHCRHHIVNRWIIQILYVCHRNRCMICKCVPAHVGRVCAKSDCYFMQCHITYHTMNRNNKETLRIGAILPTNYHRWVEKFRWVESSSWYYCSPR